MSGTTSGVEFTKTGSDLRMHVFRGKSLGFEVIWGGDAPIDVTGCTAKLQARTASGRLLLDLTTENGGIALGGTDGKLTFSATAAQTRAVDSPGLFELELVSADGHTYRVMSGDVTVESEIAQ